jgi:hypothetical protein
MTTETPEAPEAPAHVVTDERAQMLANHVIYVQGGVSDAATERARAEDEITRGGSIDWHAMKAEVMTAIAARMASLPPERTHAAPAPAAAASAAAEVEATPEPEVAPQRVNVTAVLASVDAGSALRDRIKALTAELKIHEDNIKDALGAAVEGTDAVGTIVVRYPHRNRSNIVKAKVQEKLSPEDYAECITETSYRTLLYGESGS